MKKCYCGSREFELLGIQERFNSKSNNDEPILYLYNCSKCHTTISTFDNIARTQADLHSGNHSEIQYAKTA